MPFKALTTRALRPWRWRSELFHMDYALMRLGNWFSYKPTESGYSLPAFPGPERSASGEFPMPPRPLWAHYCTNATSWLQSGLDDTTTMRAILQKHGAPIESAARILDLGSAGGRMIRHLAASRAGTHPHFQLIELSTH